MSTPASTLPSLSYGSSSPSALGSDTKESTVVGDPSIKSETSSVLEKLPWDGYLEANIPEKKEGKVMRDLRHLIFTIYHRLFGVVFAANIGILIALFVYGVTSQRLGLITVANIFVAILMRQDYVVNAFFDFFTAVPTSCVL